MVAVETCWESPSSCTETIAARPSVLIVPEVGESLSKGSLTEATPSIRSSAGTTEETAEVVAGVSIRRPSGETMTIWAAEPASSGKRARRSSSVAWDSLPGTVNSSLVPLAKRPASAPRSSRTTTHVIATVPRRR